MNLPQLVLVGLVSSVIVSLVSACVIQLVARMIIGFFPAYARAFHAALSGSLAVFAATWGIFYVTSNYVFGLSLIQTQIFIALINFLVLSTVYGSLIETNRGPVGFGTGMLISIGVYLVSFAVGIVLATAGVLAGARVFHSRPIITSTAAFAGADTAQKEAVRRYPELGVSGSALNREFVPRYQRNRTANPEYFRDPSWPIRLAEECNRFLSGR